MQRVDTIISSTTKIEMLHYAPSDEELRIYPSLLSIFTISINKSIVYRIGVFGYNHSNAGFSLTFRADNKPQGSFETKLKEVTIPCADLIRTDVYYREVIATGLIADSIIHHMNEEFLPVFLVDPEGKVYMTSEKISVERDEFSEDIIEQLKDNIPLAQQINKFSQMCMIVRRNIKNHFHD